MSFNNSLRVNQRFFQNFHLSFGFFTALLRFFISYGKQTNISLAFEVFYLYFHQNWLIWDEYYQLNKCRMCCRMIIKLLYCYNLQKFAKILFDKINAKFIKYKRMFSGMNYCLKNYLLILNYTLIVVWF